MKALGKKFEVNKNTKKHIKKSAIKKKKVSTKRSPIQKSSKFLNIQAFLPMLNQNQRSKSPIYPLKVLQDKIRSQRNFLRNLKKRRSSLDNNFKLQMKNNRSRKRSPFLNNGLRSFAHNKIMPKSPKVISIPTIECKKGIGRDNSVIIWMHLNFS